MRIATADPVAMTNRWAGLLGLPSSSGDTLHLSQGTIKFVPVTSGIDGLIAVDLTSSEEGRLGECHTIAGTQFQIVKVA